MKNPANPSKTPLKSPESAKVPNPPHDGSSEITKLQAQIDELTRDLQRTRADFENYRKNVEKDRANAKKLATFATVSKFLPLLDDLDRALATYQELQPLEKSFAKSLSALGLEKIDSKQGTEFNPEFHDAVMTSGDGTKEIVSETLRPGYLYEGAVLRPAMVKVENV